MEEKRKISNQKKQKKENTRRTFLKKSIYMAPTLFFLGQIVTPSKSHAGFGPPPSDVE